MSNAELAALTVIALGLHLLALTVALWRRRPQVAARIDLIFAVAILVMLASNLRWPLPPWNGPLVGFAVLELAIAAVALSAMRTTTRWAMAGVWAGFAWHTALSALAVLFALTFKMNRLF
ncbi:hypothetical protein [Phenylobacterium sp.]|uniref:hypothetical protein n=1 Tax=Phenylobacterium sp. TaxID=1871053 RepID=UPI002BF4275E|nr:hypothetical protein [Phenylobacterium sp.]HLZ73493.1 hypothetical protein [Phenylobacterium sp.]